MGRLPCRIRTYCWCRFNISYIKSTSLEIICIANEWLYCIEQVGKIWVGCLVELELGLILVSVGYTLHEWDF